MPLEAHRDGKTLALSPGDSIRRTSLHYFLGGSGQGGINPSRQTKSVLLFADAVSGPQHGYYDGWNSDGLFHYAGEGQFGNQAMKRGNKAVLNHGRDGRSIFLFRGSREIVTFIGRFEIDSERPFYITKAHESQTRGIRDVIMFRLRALEAEQPTLPQKKPEGAA